MASSGRQHPLIGWFVRVINYGNHGLTAKGIRARCDTLPVSSCTHQLAFDADHAIVKFAHKHQTHARREEPLRRQSPVTSPNSRSSAPIWVLSSLFMSRLRRNAGPGTSISLPSRRRPIALRSMRMS